jgi:hypothetical protein
MTDNPSDFNGLDRRRFLALLSAVAAAPGVLAAQEKKKGTVTAEMLAQAEKVTGLEFTDAERELMLDGLDEQLADYRAIHEFHLDNGVAPAVRMDPVPPGMTFKGESAFRLSSVAAPDASAEEMPFLAVTQLGKLLRTGKVTSVGLTKMYLERLRKLDPILHAVITYTEERAMEQAERADRELASGQDRGPLHGIPWGA